MTDDTKDEQRYWRRTTGKRGAIQLFNGMVREAQKTFNACQFTGVYVRHDHMLEIIDGIEQHVMADDPRMAYGCVEVAHEDGSFFKIKPAMLVKFGTNKEIKIKTVSGHVEEAYVNQWLVVFTVNHGTMLFSTDELAWYKSYRVKHN